MEIVDILRWLHVVGATVLLGTGSGIAFFMVMAHRSGDPKLIAHVAGTVVVADLIFTASAVVLQPITGVALAYAAGRSLEALLAGITPWDLPTFATGIAVSLAMTLAGSCRHVAGRGCHVR